MHQENNTDLSRPYPQPEFRIEKRVHADKMPLLNHVYDEHKRNLS
jgi:hypothetical protein